MLIECVQTMVLLEDHSLFGKDAEEAQPPPLRDRSILGKKGVSISCGHWVNMCMGLFTSQSSSKRH